VTRVETPVEEPAIRADPADGAPTRFDRQEGGSRQRARSLWWWLGGGGAVVMVAVVLVAAGTFSSATTSPSTPPLPAPADTSAPAGVVDTGQNMPSPFVLVYQGHDYLYTGGHGPGLAPNVPVREVSTLANLAEPTEAMPILPPGTGNWIWTVDVFKAASGFVMWFTSQDLAKLNPAGVADQCIWTATAPSPLGPFTPSTTPAICQQWGSIDPRTTTGPDGTRYLVWKSDLNADHTDNLPTTIWEQELAPDGTTLLGSAHQIATATQPWEQRLIESPDLVRLGSTYYLFFAGNSSLSPDNGVGVMRCAGIQGPCTDTGTTPLVASNYQGLGPGEESLYQQAGVTWLLYSPNAVFGPYVYRPLAVARVALGRHGPYVAAFDGAVPGR
jgi:arabinan endo-1,5-alpha-L-arabinosidase